MLTGWAAGSHAERLGGRSHQEITERALEAIASLLQVRPECLRDEWVAGYSHDWQADAFSRGAYSWTAAGGIDAARDLARPLGPLFFAGEATDWRGYNATVHGAIASGRRAAAEVLEVARTALA